MRSIFIAFVITLLRGPGLSPVMSMALAPLRVLILPIWSAISKVAQLPSPVRIVRRRVDNKFIFNAVG